MANEPQTAPVIKTLAEGWAHYERTVLPKNAPPLDRARQRRAFYIGAATFFDITMRFDDDDDIAAGQLKALSDELDAFAAAIMAGRK